MKNRLLSALLPTFIALSSTSALAVQLDELVQVHKSDGTYFKASTAQSSSLPASQKCFLNDKDIMHTSSIRDGGANHFKVTLPRAYPGCSLTEGYLYQGHVSTEPTSLTVTSNTIFKTSTASSSTLPDSQKCALPIGFYKSSLSITEQSGHFKVNFSEVPAGCGFSAGYVFNGHAVKGARGLTLRSSAYLKTSTANSSTLPSSQKCLVPAGDYVRTGLLGDSEDHYRVTLAQNPPGCGFKEGYIYYFNTTFEQPSASGGGSGGSGTGNYIWPQPGSDLGSAWCVCRSIGTSPHIGQDFVQFGAKRAVAVESGRIISSTFSASCGHIVQFQDDTGATWRYVHLNQPGFGVGARLSAGQKIADISAYPRSGCGTGPHLHFERRSAGGFNDSSVGKSCQNGFRTCHFDPIKPWRNNRNGGSEPILSRAETASVTTAFATGNALEKGAENGQAVSRSDSRFASRSVSSASNDIKQNVAPIALPKSTQAVAQLEGCKVHPKQYAQDSAARLSQFSEADASQVAVKAGYVMKQGQKVLDVSAHLAGNELNQCRLNAGQDCIVSWSVVSENQDGSLSRLFHDAAVRNQKVSRIAKESYCLPQITSDQVTVMFTLASGKQVRVSQYLNQAL